MIPVCASDFLDQTQSTLVLAGFFNAGTLYDL